LTELRQGRKIAGKLKDKGERPMLANLKGRQSPHHYSGLSTDLKPTTGVPYGSTYYETDTYVWRIFSIAGWLAETDGMDAQISRLIQVSDHSIAITIANAAAAQTDTITIDGVACAFTSDATPTKLEVSNGLIAAIAASLAAGSFVVSQGAGPTYSIILKPAGILEPVVTVSANLADTPTDGYARPAGAAGARLDAIYFDAPLNGVVTLADAGVVKTILPIATPAAGVHFYGAKFITRLEVKVDNVADLGTVIWRVL
jgi:hypothetical protein